MSDLALKLQSNSTLMDLNIFSNGIELEHGLRTAILISLFTDQRISEEELPYGHSDLRGWWGDMISELEGDEIGSKLWILERNKQTTATLNDYIEYAKKSLEWMIEDGVASSVEVTGEFPSRETLTLEVKITPPIGNPEKHAVLWDFEKDQVYAI